MGKTFRKNEGRRPKWDKRGKKSHKIRDYEEERFNHRPQSSVPLKHDPIELLNDSFDESIT